MGTSVSRYTATAWKANGEALRSKEPSNHRYSHRLPSKGLDLEMTSQTPPVADHVQSQGRHDAHPPQWVIGTATWTSQNRDPVLPRQWANGTVSSSCWANGLCETSEEQESRDRWAVDHSYGYPFSSQLPTGNIDCGDSTAV